MKSSRDGSYIVYDDKDFANHHTHVIRKSVANQIKKNVLSNTIPASNNIRLLISHLRVASDQTYITELRSKIQSMDRSGYTHNLEQHRDILLERIKLFIKLKPSVMMAMTNNKGTDYIEKAKYLAQYLDYMVDIDYSFVRSTFTITHKDIVDPKGFEIIIFPNFSSRITLNKDSHILSCTNYDGIHIKELVEVIDKYMKAGDEPRGETN